jgi:RNA polymerase sigma factor (sigma-70 family)
MSMDGRPAAFLEQIDRHRGILFKVSGAYGRTAHDREDLVQETIVQLWRSHPRYDGRVAFSTWMYRIAMNVAISFYRSERRRRERVTAPESALDWVPAAENPPGDERLDVIHEFIERLDPLDRGLMLLYLDDYPYAEIAAILGISESNVGTKIGRIKERLKRSVADAPQ